MNETTSLYTQVLNCPWDQFEKTFGPANLKWCEQRACSIINEPVNTWSNIPYILVGLFILYIGLQKKNNKIHVFQVVFGFSVTIMGLFSFIYHATNNFLTQIFDFVGMYFYIYLLFCTCLFLLKKISLKQGLLIYIALIIFSTSIIPLAYRLHFPYQSIVAFVAISITFLQFKIYKKNPTHYPFRLFTLSISSFLIAGLFSYLDGSRKLCFPESRIFQGHAVWHILSCLGVWLSYKAFTHQLKENSII